jgi:IclR family transcriptional regulator, KDG regulon repressor
MVPAIKRAFDVLELLANQDAGLTISELQRSLQLPLSSVATIVYTLLELGYLEREAATSRYSLTVKMFGIARRPVDRMGLNSHCHELLEEMVRESGLTGHLAVRQGSESMYLDRVASEGLLQVSSYVGLRWPLHTSAVGKALLAFLPETELAHVLRQMTLKKLTPGTITSRDVLEQQLTKFRRLGYTWEINEGEWGVACVAAPVFGPRHEVVAAISLTGTTQQITKSRLPALGALVRRYAGSMSAQLGDHHSSTLP